MLELIIIGVEEQVKDYAYAYSTQLRAWDLSSELRNKSKIIHMHILNKIKGLLRDLV